MPEATPFCPSVIKTSLFNNASISLFFSSTLSFLLSKLPLKKFCTFHASLFFLSFLNRLHCPYPGTHTLIISPIIFPSKIAKSEKDHLPQGPDYDSPRTSAPGRGSEWGTAGRPPSSLEERVWGWRTGLTPVRWWSGSQVKKTSGPMMGGWSHTRSHTQNWHTPDCMSAPAFSNEHAHVHTHTHTLSDWLLY